MATGWIAGVSEAEISRFFHQVERRVHPVIAELSHAVAAIFDRRDAGVEHSSTLQLERRNVEVVL